MPARPNITKIYMAINREFSFNPKAEDLHSKYNFLANKEDYFNTVIKDDGYLAKKKLYIENLGTIRSVLDLTANTCGADNFFQYFQEYYCDLANKGLYLIPHYPCVIDILPKSETPYEAFLNTFPGSLKDATIANISASIRLYPIGFGSLKFGLYLQTDKSFDIRDIIHLLSEKDGIISVPNLGGDFTIDRLTRAYGEFLLEALFKNKKPFSWSSTYSFVDIIESEQLSLESDFKDFFLPLSCLGRTPKNKKRIPKNQSLYGDILLFGEKSAISNLPFALDGNRQMNPHRRKLRRWVRDSTELFSAQQFACHKLEAINVTRTLEELKAHLWTKKLKDAILPPPLEEIYGYRNYTELQNQESPLRKQDWRERHSELIRMLDPEKKIAFANRQSKRQLASIKKQSKAAQQDVAKAMKLAEEIIREYVKMAKPEVP